MKKRVFSALLAMTILLSLLSAAGASAFAWSGETGGEREMSALEELLVESGREEGALPEEAEDPSLPEQGELPTPEESEEIPLPEEDAAEELPTQEIAEEAEELEEPLPEQILIELEEVSAAISYISVLASEMVRDEIQIFTIQYDPNMLELIDFAAQTHQKDTEIGDIPGTAVSILSHDDGVIILQCNRNIPEGKTWSGVVTVLQFQALESGRTTLSLDQ